MGVRPGLQRAVWILVDQILKRLSIKTLTLTLPLICLIALKINRERGIRVMIDRYVGG